MSEMCGDRWLETGSPFKRKKVGPDRCSPKKCPLSDICERTVKPGNTSYMVIRRQGDIYCEHFEKRK